MSNYSSELDEILINFAIDLPDEALSHRQEYSEQKYKAQLEAKAKLHTLITEQVVKELKGLFIQVEACAELHAPLTDVMREIQDRIRYQLKGGGMSNILTRSIYIPRHIKEMRIN